jgi:hypothetical protein
MMGSIFSDPGGGGARGLMPGGTPIPGWLGSCCEGSCGIAGPGGGGILGISLTAEADDGTMTSTRRATVQSMKAWPAVLWVLIIHLLRRESLLKNPSTGLHGSRSETNKKTELSLSRGDSASSLRLADSPPCRVSVTALCGNVKSDKAGLFKEYSFSNREMQTKFRRDDSLGKYELWPGGGKVNITGVICPWMQRGVRGDFIV